MKPFLQFCFLFSLVAFAVATQHQVEVELVANWKQTPLYLEIGEFIAAEESNKFWAFLDEIAQTEISSLPNEQSKFDKSLEIASRLLTSSQVMMLNYALRIRYYSPKVQMFRQLNSEQTSKCNSAFVLFKGKTWCGTQSLDSFLNEQKSSEVSTITTYPGDHIYGASSNGIGSQNLPAIVLYCTPGSKEFSSLHSTLKTFSESTGTPYVFRYLVPPSEDLLHLPSYGVELAIKSLEYKVIDDSKVEGTNTAPNTVSIEQDESDVSGILFGTVQNRKPHLASELANFKSYLLSQDEKFEDLKVWNLRDLGFQSSQRIIAASDPLKLMTDISQNFPSFAVALSKVALNDTLKMELRQNAQFIPKNVVLLNGRVVDPETTDPYQLYPIIQEEIQKFQTLNQLRVPHAAIPSLLASQVSVDATARFNVNGDFIVWLNNLEKDPSYKGFGRSVRDMLRPAWPGSFRYIAKNLFSVVFLANFDNPKSLLASTFVENMIKQSAPIRFGFLFSSNSATSVGASAYKIAKYLSDKYGGTSVINFCSSLHQLTLETNELLSSHLQSAFAFAIQRTPSAPKNQNLVMLLSTITNSEDQIESLNTANQFMTELGVKETPAMFINGVAGACSGVDETYSSIINEYFKQLPWIQDLVSKEVITDQVADIYQTILKQPSTFSRFNGNIIVPKNMLVYKSMLQASASQHDFLKNLKYFTHPLDLDTIKPLTHLVFLDLTENSGIQLAKSSLELFADERPELQYRIGFIFNSKTSSLLERALIVSESQIMTKRLRFAKALLSVATPEISKQEIIKIAETAGLSSSFASKLDEQIDIEAHRSISTQLYGIERGQLAIVTNGRLIHVDTTGFNVHDFKLLSEVEFEAIGKYVLNQVLTVTYEDFATEDFSHLIFTLSSLLGAESSKDVEKMHLHPYAVPSLKISGENPAIRVEIALNPISVQTQRFVPMLQAIMEDFNLGATLYLIPTEFTNLPMKNYYQYVIPRLSFDENGKLKPPTALFTHPPPQRLLTLNLDVPSSWLVSPIEAVYDLDNLRLQDIPAGVVTAKFELQHLVVEGNCFEISNARGPSPPRGVQLVISPVVNSNSTSQYYGKKDTLVMANLGYYQLKANPGFWDLELKENSRTEELYQITGVTGYRLPSNFEVLTQRLIPVDSFGSFFHQLRLVKKAGFEFADVLEAPETQANTQQPQPEADGIWGTISNLWESDAVNPTQYKTEGHNETINVFSLASGHLYERFLKIMFLSVRKHTNNPVKFWLLANFLSPKFKNSISSLAQKYNFDYEFVTYKWPVWLFKQTEKQRLIWAYKILFLDVLFPLDLKKVIYVDADQVVRADLNELLHFDLQGAPYAYTPFCDSNPSTEGFRFWKQGFWQSHLRGLPYHISALYLVDLQKFRQTAAGDSLRATYQSLAPDPNSLSNLDQDLPNYLQHVVKIKSLPQEWLWCETWCSQESKTKAKTIDLCNNPLTKTPKLENAVKIIEEWTSLDNEAKETRSLEN